MTTPYAGFIFCLFNLGINEISENVYVAVEPMVHGILRSQIVAEMTLSVMRGRGPRMSQKVLKTKRGLRRPKSHLLSKKEKEKKKAQISKPSGDGRGAESTSPASE